LHDTPGACADRLPELLDRLEALDVQFTQDIPDSCIATSGGIRTAVVDALLRG
jgi:hypothetical protein